MANLWNTMGYAYHNNASLSGSAAVLAVTRDATNSKLSSSFPSNCEITSVEIFMTSISTATQVTMHLTRDSVGDISISPGGTTGATQAIKTGVTAGTGSVVFTTDIDFNFDSDATNATAGTVYAVVSLDAGSATGDIRINWRGI